MSTVKKRLHISGLTPAITASDLNARLHGFGEVLSLDGLGALNAVGEPRKFAYATLEATQPNLARCLNVLSGTMWKGAKLRIGEAKPDYSQRLENECKRTAEGGEEHPAKRRRLPRGVQGVHAGDMSVVNLANVNSHPGWHKTSLSHLIRPMKMRPSHPLPAPSSGRTLKLKSTSKKTKKPGAPDVPTRARVRVIDPRLYEPVHLREGLLEAIVDSHTSQPHTTHLNPSNSKSTHRTSVPKRTRSASLSSSVSDATRAPGTDTLRDVALWPAIDDDPEEGVELSGFEKDRVRDLHLLSTMFGDDEGQWGGKESVEDEPSEGAEAASNVAAEVQLTPATEPTPQTASSLARPKSKMLKDLFQPHAEEAGFSLIAGLGDIDLDLDLAFDLDADTTPISAPVRPAIPIPPLAMAAPMQPGGVALDPTLPMFFPHPENPRAVDLFSVAQREGWEFGRSGDSETIRRRWDETKGVLTREWKKRAREAVKLRKRRYGAPGGEDA